MNKQMENVKVSQLGNSKTKQTKKDCKVFHLKCTNINGLKSSR